ncbi:MAG: tRNA A-37 threonylcarbamoyl transferase component Bud32 [Verrucomicrobiales bacterium]|jgi:tRNA A-37 threonylcarbamoyl transferase component Bud32
MPPADDTPNSVPESNSGMFVAPSVLDLQDALPQFEIIELIGQGGMGAVYKARQPRLNRIVAIKLLPPLLGPDEFNYAKRFELEAQAMARMNHPNIVTVHDFGEADGGLRYIVMEHVDGTDLHHLIHGAQLTKAHVISWISQICGALQYAHENGLVHRDIKPANILISPEGEAKVVDFGLAKLADPSKQIDSQLTRPDVAMGTVDYSAPEAMESGAEIDGRADIYSLGVLFYEMLTGKVPRGAWKPPSKLNSEFDPRFDAIIVKAMQPLAADRYQSVAQISTALSEILKSPNSPAAAGGAAKKLAIGVLPVATAETAPSTPAPAAKSRLPIGLWVGIGALVVAAIVGFIIMSDGGDTKTGQDEGKGKNKGSKVAKGPKGKGKGKEPEKNPGRPQNPPDRPGRPGPQNEFRLPDNVKADPLPDGFADALAGLDLSKAVLGGKWRSDRGFVMGGPDKGGFTAGIELATPVSKVYQIKASFFRANADSDIVIVVPVGDGHYAPIHLCGFKKYAGIGGIDRRPLDNAGNPTRQPERMIKNGINRAEIWVQIAGDGASIGVDLNGRPLVDWSGKIDLLPTDDPWKPRNPDRISIGGTGRMLIATAHVNAASAAAPTEPPPTPPTPPTPPPTVVEAGWINPLEAIDIKEAMVDGSWSLIGNTVRNEKRNDDSPRLEIGPAISGSYDFNFTFTREEGEGNVVLILPIDGERFAPIYLSGFFGKVIGIHGLGGQSSQSDENPTSGKLAIDSGRKYEGMVQVSRNGPETRIVLKLGGESIIDWNGPTVELPEEEGFGWEPRSRDRISIGAVDPTIFEELRIRSGSAPGGDPDGWVDMLKDLDLEAGTIVGEWQLRDLNLVRRDAGIGFPRFEFPQVSGPNYDLEFTVSLPRRVEDIMINLPVAGTVGVFHLAAMTNKTAISPLDGNLLTTPGNPTERKSPLVVETRHKVEIRVRSKDTAVAINAKIDGEVFVDWTGIASQLGENRRWESRDPSKIALGAAAAAIFSDVRFRPAPAGMPDPPKPAVAPKLVEIAKATASEVEISTFLGFKKEMDALNLSYRASLLKNTEVAANASVQAEMARLDQGQPITETDPPGTHDIVVSRRGVYRKEVAKYEARRGIASLPVLAQQLLKVEALKTGADPASIELIDAEIAKIRTRVEEIRAAAAAEGIEVSENIPGAAPASLQRPTLPFPVITVKGGVVAWERTGKNTKEGMGRVPGGLSQTVVAISGGSEIAAALKDNGRVEVWGEFEAGLPKSEIKDLDDVVRIELRDSSYALHLATLDKKGNVRVVSAGWSEPTTFEDQANSLTDVVETSIHSIGGIAIHDSGKVSLWGSSNDFTESPDNVVKIARGPFLNVMLLEDGTTVSWGEFVSAFPKDLGKIQDVAVALQSTEAGGVVHLQDGSLIGFGTFASMQPDFEDLSKTRTVRRIVAGSYAVAVEIGEGKDYEWRFFGQGLDNELCAEEAEGCSDIVIGREYIVGFRPN